MRPSPPHPVRGPRRVLEVAGHAARPGPPRFEGVSAAGGGRNGGEASGSTDLEPQKGLLLGTVT